MATGTIKKGNVYTYQNVMPTEIRDVVYQTSFSGEYKPVQAQCYDKVLKRIENVPIGMDNGISFMAYFINYNRLYIRPYIATQAGLDRFGGETFTVTLIKV